jgi:IclR family transcriptional regulator, pca regulon regulatory protein
MAARHRLKPQFSQSLAYGVAILECFTIERPAVRISELADMLELSRSTAHRYAATLVVLGYLEQDKGRRYRLSPYASRPGLAFIDTIRLETPAAVTILEDLREQTGHTVSMGALDGTRVIYTHRLLAHGTGQYEADMDLAVGTYVPAHCTAIGKSLLASLSEPEQREALARLTLTREGPNTIMSKPALASELACIRADRVAVCNEEQKRGVRSIAAAIPHPGRSRPLAVSVTVPAEPYTVKAMIAKFGPHVRAAAERI